MLILLQTVQWDVDTVTNSTVKCWSCYKQYSEMLILLQIVQWNVEMCCKRYSELLALLLRVMWNVDPVTNDTVKILILL